MKHEVNDAFLYDVHRMSRDTSELWDALRNLRTVVTTAKERWKNVVNKEPQMEREINLYKDKAKDTLRDVNLSLYSVTGQSINIDIDELVNEWLNNDRSELIKQLVSAVENRGDFQVLTEHTEDGWPRTHNIKRVDVEEIEGDHFIMIREA